MSDTTDIDDSGTDPEASDAAVRTDGGNVSSPFEVVSQYEETRTDRLRKFYDAYVYAPIAIVWRDWRARFGFTVVFLYLFMGIAGPLVIEPTQVTEGPALAQPFETWEYPLGTDDMGRDLFAQTVYSTTTILQMVLAGAVSVVTIGTVVGAVAGYKGGWVDTALSSVTDVFINIPGFPLVMVLGLLLPIGGNPYAVGVLLSIAAWGGLARAIRSQVLTLRREEFVEVARAMDLPTRKIVFGEIVPHLMPYVVINLTNAGRRVIFQAVALYYLGILPFETSSLNWGVTLNYAYEANAHIREDALHWFLVPMVAIVGISAGLILLGQSLDRVFNPRVRARHEKTTVEGEADPEADEPSTNDVIGGI